ncbi:MAG TPA: PDZ domain-containing protein [Syntrophorhabdaceae bacterium]|nr:PDZ domain-containing protein [Syntrophorhabdaceae bacterium]
MERRNVNYHCLNPRKTGLRFILLLIVLAFVTACATSPQKAQWKRDTSKPLYCSKGNDCEAKWSRALAWVKGNARSGIKIASDTIISTETPNTSDDAAFSITKVKTNEETYTINFRASCHGLLGPSISGCKPSVLELKASFANFVMKADASAATDATATSTPEKNRMPAKPRVDLGAVATNTSAAAAVRLGMREQRGVRIIFIEPDGIAFDRGLRQDDVILKYGEKTINDVADLNAAIEETVPRETVPITIWRAGAGEMVVSVQF